MVWTNFDCVNKSFSVWRNVHFLENVWSHGRVVWSLLMFFPDASSHHPGVHHKPAQTIPTIAFAQTMRATSPKPDHHAQFVRILLKFEIKKKLKCFWPWFCGWVVIPVKRPYVQLSSPGQTEGWVGGWVGGGMGGWRDGWIGSIPNSGKFGAVAEGVRASVSPLRGSFCTRV